MKLAFGEIELRTGKSLGVCGIRETCLHLRLVDAWKLAERLRAPLTHHLGELSLKVSEVKKRTRGGKLLTLKEHGRSRPQKHHGGQGFIAARTGQPMAAQAVAGVGDLVVILDEGHERGRL